MVTMLIIVIIAAIIFDFSRKPKKNEQPYNIADYLPEGFRVRDIYETIDGDFLGYDDAQKKIVIVSDLESRRNPYIYSVKDILEIEIIKNSDSVTKTGPLSLTHNATLGGLFLDRETSATIGVLTADKTTSEEIKRLDLRIVVNDLKNPIHNISFLLGRNNANIVDAERWYAILRILIKQSEDAEV